MVSTSSTGAGPNALNLLSGDAQAFREKVWASHVHLHHTDPDDLVGLLSLDDVDHLLTEVALRAPAHVCTAPLEWRGFGAGVQQSSPATAEWTPRDG